MYNRMQTERVKTRSVSQCEQYVSKTNIWILKFSGQMNHGRIDCDNNLISKTNISRTLRS